MRLGPVRHLVAHAGLQREPAAVGQLGFKFPREHQQDVAFRAPVVRGISGGLLDHTHPDVIELLRPPVGDSADAAVFGFLYLGPIGGPEWNGLHFHGWCPS